MKDAILVTGASTGIGRACAEELVDKFRVFGSVRKESDAEVLRASGVEPVVMDVADAATIDSGHKQILESLHSGQSFWGLVNNAGVVFAGPMEAISIADLRTQFEVNVFGHVAVTQKFLPQIRKSKGRIVMMSSNNGRLAPPFLGPYCSSKFAMEGFTDSWRRELIRWGIQVSLVQPGAIATPIWDKSKETNEEREKLFAPEMEELYGGAMDVMRQMSANRMAMASPVGVVVDAVRHALVAPKAKARYLVGADAKQPLLLQSLLPTAVADRLILAAMGMKDWLQSPIK